MNEDLAKRINRMLGEHGLAPLSDPGLFGQVAYLIRDHAHFRSMLVQCEPEKRNSMHQSLAPNLRFKARSLDEYLTEAREDAEARRLPIQKPDGTLAEYRIPEIE